ncbi:MAG: lactonase family protein, partial [Verrucomicrobiales bacterium]|nr:lactonase family protein [Verrucomicrobiales bacterium]
MKFLVSWQGLFTFLLGVIFLSAFVDARGAQGEFLVYFGTYTGESSKGIYVARLDASGKLGSPELAAEIASPSFLAVHPNRKFLYAVNEIGNYQGKKAGGVSAFAIDQETGKLTLLNQQSSIGDGPCHLVVDKAGKQVLVANYGGGSTTVLPIDREGRLGESTAFIQHQGSSINKQRQGAPHAHCVTLDNANRFAFVADLGLDKVLVFKCDPAKGKLIPNDPPAASVKPGAGPRHFALDPKGRYGYVINEIDCTVTAFSYDAQDGVLNQLQTVSTLPAGETVQRGYSTAEITVHPSG